MSTNSGIETIVGDLGGNVIPLIERIAPTDATVLITGETGTGKTIVAKYIHCHSDRRDGHFVPVNCAALPETLLESELFGYVKGAFTDAAHNKPGRFEAANNGTIFLDEIGDVPLHIQVKLLRVIEEKEYERLGDNKSQTTNARIIAATNQNLVEAIEKKTFRADLYYRLQTFEIEIPPLRQRKDDITPLIYHFLVKSLKDLGRKASVSGSHPIVTVDDKVLEIETDFIKALLNYDFPGNARELLNYVSRAAVMVDGGHIIKHSYLPERVRTQSRQKRLIEDSLAYGMMTSQQMLDDMETLGMDLKTYLMYLRIMLIHRALEVNGGVCSTTAKALGYHRASFYKTIEDGRRFLKEHNMPVPKYLLSK